MAAVAAIADAIAAGEDAFVAIGDTVGLDPVGQKD